MMAVGGSNQVILIYGRLCLVVHAPFTMKSKVIIWILSKGTIYIFIKYPVASEVTPGSI